MRSCCSRTARRPAATLTPLDGAARARDAGIRVFTVALGTKDGTLGFGGGPFGGYGLGGGFGGGGGGNGNRRFPVRPDPATLAAIARETDGKTFEAKSAAKVESIYKQLGSSIAQRQVNREISSWFVGAAALLARSASRSQRRRVHRRAVALNVEVTRSRFSSRRARKTPSLNVGYGWITSSSTSIGISARIASVSCCSHSPASGPTATAPVEHAPLRVGHDLDEARRLRPLVRREARHRAERPSSSDDRPRCRRPSRPAGR